MRMSPGYSATVAAITLACAAAAPARRLQNECTDGSGDATDPYGDSCDDYASNPDWCGGYNDDDFTSETMCCGCGGGCTDTSDGATDPYGDSCADYASNPDWCGGYNDDDFTSETMCCGCGGGNDMMTPACWDTDNGATDSYDDGCAGYNSNPSWCGNYDDEDFSSVPMCCGWGLLLCVGEAIFAFAGQIFLKLQRPSADSIIKYSWNWGDSTPPRIVFSFASVPFYTEHSSCYQWTQHFPGSASAQTFFGEATWFEDKEDYQDIYHCASECDCSSFCGDGGSSDCDGPFGTSNGDMLYITISGADIPDMDSDTEVRGWLNFEFLPPGPTIKQAQLDAIKHIWKHNCWPTLQHTPVFGGAAEPNVHWKRQDHMLGMYSVTKRNEAFEYPHIFNTTCCEDNSDNVPFCDWNFDTDPNTTYQGYESVNTSSCEDIDYVLCDSEGNVVELLLRGRGLTGELDFSQLEQLTSLKTLDLGGNRLTGDISSYLFTSTKLEKVYVDTNHFSGSIPCPETEEFNLAELSLANNEFTGSLPACLFTMLPRLRDLSVSHNTLTDAVIPPDIKNAQQLVTFRAHSAGLGGTLPVELKCVRRLKSLGLSGNAMTGELPQDVINGLANLDTLDVSFNTLSGVLPDFSGTGVYNSSLRYLYLNNNKFSGGVATQLLKFSEAQENGISSSINIAYNALTGPLPSAMYNMLMDAHGVSRVITEGNYFHCDGETGDWPAWVWRVGSFADGNPSRYTHSLGICKKVPIVASAMDGTIGSFLAISGSDFAPTDELKCRLTLGDSVTVTQALFRSPTAIECLLADFTETGEVEVTVANYGMDFYSSTTHPQAYAAVKAVVSAAPAPPPISNEEDLTPEAIAGISIAAVVILCCCCVFLGILIKREKEGKPVFTAMK